MMMMMMMMMIRIVSEARILLSVDLQVGKPASRQHYQQQTTDHRDYLRALSTADGVRLARSHLAE